MPSFPELEQPLSDSVATVRAAAERDIPEVLIAYQDDPDLHLRLAQARPPSGAELGRRAEQAEANRALGRELTLTIVETPDDTCRGQIHVQQVDWDSSRADLTIWVAPDRRGRQLGTRALSLTAPWLLRDCGLERVQVLTEPDNAAMIRSAQSAGFTNEGVLRGYTRVRGRRVDNVVLSMVTRDLRG
jgi:RimJ/RimL family protein N-acetyltransferase